MVISELLSEITNAFAGVENASFEAAQILGFVLKMTRTELIIKRNDAIDKSDETKALNLVKRRLSGEPLQHILGTWEFMSLPFSVSRDALIPRQDTETLVEFILSERNDLPTSLLDIGTGTGCIPISLAHFKKDFNCIGLDISEKALDLARKNADNIGVSDRVSFFHCDILTEIPDKMFDVVVSNPPYIKSGGIDGLQTEVRDFEPHIALDGGIDGLMFYRRICDIAPKILKKGGLLAFEIGFDQADAVFSLMNEAFDRIIKIKDLSGNDRVMAGYLKNTEEDNIL